MRQERQLRIKWMRRRIDSIKKSLKEAERTEIACGARLDQMRAAYDDDKNALAEAREGTTPYAVRELESALERSRVKLAREQLKARKLDRALAAIRAELKLVRADHELEKKFGTGAGQCEAPDE
ncbi:MAG TPA: hypothetical protein VFH56_17140 [Acidimicrobiales bacterium]|nr:hypothetical protein [Acidimicrobiales bacterium]